MQNFIENNIKNAKHNNDDDKLFDKIQLFHKVMVELNLLQKEIEKKNIQSKYCHGNLKLDNIRVVSSQEL